MVLVPSRNYVMVEVTENFRSELGELRRVAQLVAFTSGLGYEAMPLEGFWSGDDESGFDPTRLGVWCWTAAIALPSDLIFDTIRRLIVGKGPHGETIATRTVEEGQVVQALHLGPYHTVGATIDKIRRELDRQQLEPAGSYHEIYLTDPISTLPGESRTVIRQPARPSERFRPPSVFDLPAAPHRSR